MKLNKIMLLSIFLLALLTLGVASASENNTDNLEIDGGIDLSASVDEDIVADAGSDQPKDVEIIFPETIKACEKFDVNVTLPEDAYGEVKYYFEGYEDDYDCYYPDPGFSQFSFKINEFGTHTLKVKFTSYNEETCNSKEVSKTYDIKDYGMDIYIEESQWDYGESNAVVVDLPSHTGIVVVDINGKKYNIDLDEEFVVWVNYGPVTTSNVTVKVTYKGDGKNLKPISAEKVFFVKPNVYIPEEVIFGNSSKVVVNYANGEQIKFQLKDYDEPSIIYDEKTLTVTDSKAVYVIPDNLEFDKQYCVEVIHNNATVGFNNFNVVPNMDLPRKYYSKRTYDIPVVFPEEYKNKNVSVFMNSDKVFEGKTDNTGKCNIHLADLTPDEVVFMYIELNDDDNPLIYSYSRYVEVSDIDPSSVNLTVNVPAENIKGFDVILEFSLPEGIDGEVISYVDGKEVSRDSASYFMAIYVNTEKLAFGAHTLTLNYTGDGYFEPKSMSYQFNVSQYIIEIPETLYYNNFDSVCVRFMIDATGTLIIYADGKQVKKFNVAEDFYDVDDEYGHAFYCPINSLNLKLGSHNIRVYYKGNHDSFDITKKVNVDYTIPIYVDEYIYGRENYVEFSLPEDYKGSFNVTIDGKPVKYKATDDNNYFEVDVTEYFGDHVIAVEYFGDNKYNHPIVANKTFNVAAFMDYNEYVTYKSEMNAVSLVLPKDAKGNLVVEVDGEVYIKKAFENGTAAISFDNLKRGYYNVHVYYDGDDYYVADKTFELSVLYNILVSSNEVLFNESVDVYINLPSSRNGTLTVSFNGDTFKERLVDGYAKITLSGFNLGDNMCYAEFIEDGEEPVELSSEITISANPIVDISDNFVVFGKNIISISVPSGFNGFVVYSYDDYEKKVSINSQKTDVSMPLVTAGLNEIYVSVRDMNDDYLFSEIYTVNVSKAAAPKLFATSATVYNGFNYNVKVLGTDGKPLKGAKVTFQVGKNKVVAKKTNANGIASLPMNYKPAKYTVVVKYAKQTLKPKVTVKKVLTLNTVTVKKSAKKLVLTATLKKGKTPIKGKIVTFKFSGKTYKIKTNAKGIAKATIKSNVLKKLKVGNKVTYQATYLKEVVKKSANVKK